MRPPMPKPIYCLNGPNLNLLGTREPDIYGHHTLADIERLVRSAAADFGFDVVFWQGNHEGDLVDKLQKAGQEASAVLLNAAAYTHTSVAIRDAVSAITCPVIEVHLSNPAAREPFRNVNYLAGVVAGSIAGFGATGYVLGVEAVVRLLEIRQGSA